MLYSPFMRWNQRMVIVGALFLSLPMLENCKQKSPHAGSEASKGIKCDFATPEGAIVCLEDAYRAKDLEACVKAKDFRMESRLMLEEMKKPEISKDEDILQKTTEVLELTYRTEVRQNGFPDMTGLSCHFPKKEEYKKDIVVVTEVCRYPDGGTSKQKILVGKTEKGWRVLNPVD